MFRTQYNEKEKLWSGLNVQPIYNPTISVAQVVLQALMKNGPKISQVSPTNNSELNHFDDVIVLWL